MDLPLLRSFAQIARAGSIAAARRGLALSQPAISGHLKSLEEEMGVQLFDRTPQGMVLTPAGEALLPLAQQVLDAEARLLAEAGRLSGATAGRVRVGTVTNPRHLHLGELLKRIVSSHPRLTLEIHHGTSASILEQVRHGRLDLGLLVGHEPTPPLARLQLKGLTVYIAVPATWRAEVETQGWDHVLRSPWVVGAADTYCGGAAREQARQASRLIEVDHPGAVLELLRAGLCAGLLHEEEALEAERAGSILLCKDRPLRPELWAVWNDPPSQPVVAVTEIMRKLWPSTVTVGNRRAL